MEHKFYKFSDHFSGYTIVLLPEDGVVGGYCDRCDEWVYESENPPEGEMDFYEELISSHGAVVS